LRHVGHLGELPLGRRARLLERRDEFALLGRPHSLGTGGFEFDEPGWGRVCPDGYGRDIAPVAGMPRVPPGVPSDVALANAREQASRRIGVGADEGPAGLPTLLAVDLDRLPAGVESAFGEQVLDVVIAGANTLVDEPDT
jgi:hypothetical protein